MSRTMKAAWGSVTVHTPAPLQRYYDAGGVAV